MATEARNRNTVIGIDRENFLRSINIVFDADEPERIAHYYPTEKSAALLGKLLSKGNERALLVVAPYGSGKSLVGAYALQTIENRHEGKPVLKELNRRLESVDPDLAFWQASRLKNENQQGIAIALQGFIDDLPRQLLASAYDSFKRLDKTTEAEQIRLLLQSESIDLTDGLNTLKKCISIAGLDRLVILWDEFGRHLETLILEGRSAEMHNLQILAEFVPRQKLVPFSLSLFLHQGFLSYASNLPQSIRREWKKIEGRFLTVDYVEDSREIYRLIGEIISSLGQGLACKIYKSNFTQRSKELIQEGRFTGFKQRELSDLLERCYPLSPAALELLPRISARISQNERTLFSFLFQLDLAQTDIGGDVLFDYFSDQMQADVDIGGTHRQWLETQSALSKVAGDAQAEKLLKVTCLLGLGLSGERTRATRAQLALAMSTWVGANSANEVIDELINRKLLLHRKHSDEVAVWHGTDLDLRGRLTQEKADREAGFDLVAFLTKEARPPIWKPQEYNDEFSVRRFFISDYITIDQLAERDGFIASGVTVPKPDEDGRIFYVLATTADEVAQARPLLERLAQFDSFQADGLDRVVFAMPAEPLPLTDTALEVACLLEMEHDKELTSEDPLILPEIQQMLDDSRSHLQQLIDRLTIPKPDQIVSWFHHGRASEISSPRLLRRFLSDLMRRVYPSTPKISNELIVRKKPSAVVVNSRKKLLLALLERYGQEMFGIQGNYPDASICRTVLVGTGLYRKDSDSDRWSFISPKAVSEPGLRDVWKIVEDFFTESSSQGKSPSKLLEQLSLPPYGVRAGLFPVLVGAGLKAFAYTTSLSRDGVYIPDVMPSDIELMCREPDRYQLKVFDLKAAEIKYLETIRELFSSQPHHGDEQDLVRVSFEAVKAWLKQLPPAALSTRRLSHDAICFRDLLKRAEDPIFLLLTEIPRIMNCGVENLTDKENNALKVLKSEIENVIASYREAARLGIMEALRIEDNDPRSLREVSSDWAGSFYNILPTSHSARPIVMRMQMQYDSDEKLIDSVAAVIGRVSLPRWEDEDVAKFEVSVRKIVQDVEERCLQNDLSSLRGKPAVESVKKLLKQRVVSNINKLGELGSKKEVEELVEEVLASFDTRKTLK